MLVLHSIFSNNCHHHVARTLNIMEYKGKQNWTQVDIWWMCLTKSSYLSCTGIFKVYLPLLFIVGVIVILSVLVK